MPIPARLRGPAALAVLATSYALRRPAEVARGAVAALSLPVALAVAPAVLAWATVRGAVGLIEAAGVGLRVRRAPVLRPCADVLVGVDQLTAVCSLLSDTHLTAGGRAPGELAVDPGQWPFRVVPDTAALRDGVRRLLAAIHHAAPRTVIWCGDEVDAGDPDEWAQWRAVVASVPGLAHRLIPGNHDICINPPHHDDDTLHRRAGRIRAYQAHGPRLSDYPVIDTIAGDAGPVTVVLLDSCKHPSAHILSNAIGRFGEVQLDEVERILRRCAGPLLCVAHHHVWRDRDFLQPDEWFNTAVDADRLAAILFAYRRRSSRNQVLICHGHRHTLTAGKIDDGELAIDVVGLPSSTLGDKAGAGVLDGVLRYAVAGLRHDGRWGVALVPAGAVVDPARVRRATPISVPGPALRALSPARR